MPVIPVRRTFRGRQRVLIQDALFRLKELQADNIKYATGGIPILNATQISTLVSPLYTALIAARDAKWPNPT